MDSGWTDEQKQEFVKLANDIGASRADVETAWHLASIVNDPQAANEWLLVNAEKIIERRFFQPGFLSVPKPHPLAIASTKAMQEHGPVISAPGHDDWALRYYDAGGAGAYCTGK